MYIIRYDIVSVFLQRISNAKIYTNRASFISKKQWCLALHLKLLGYTFAQFLCGAHSSNKKLAKFDLAARSAPISCSPRHKYNCT